MNVSTHGGASQAVPPRRTRRTFMGMKITRTREKAVAATLLSVLIIGCLFIVMSLLLVQRSNNRKRERINSDQVGAINQVVLECQDAVAAASHATSFLEGFVMGSMKSLPPLNGSISARQADQSFSRFMDVSTLEMSNVPTVIFVISAPGGAFLQSNPEGSPKLKEIDFLDERGNQIEDVQSAWDNIGTGVADVIGPGAASSFLPGDYDYIMEVRQPVYNATEISERTYDTFWGFVYALVSIDAIVHQSSMVSYLKEQDMDFIMYANYTFVGNIQQNIVLTSSLKLDSNEDDEPVIDAFLENAATQRILPNNNNWYMAVKSTAHPIAIKHSTIAVVIIATIVIAVVLFVVVMAIVIYCTIEYDGMKHAPRCTPFSLLTLGPSQGEELWTLAADQMVVVMERLNALQKERMSAYRGYQLAVQLSPNTSTFVFPTVESAVRMAFDVIEELQRNPPDERLRELLGEDERLLMTYAIHWCTDATVTEDKVEDALLYAGPDVAYAGRMWVFSSPNTVTLSEAAKDCCRPNDATINDWSIAPLRSVYLLGVNQRQELYTIMDRGSDLQRAAYTTTSEWLKRRLAAAPERELGSMSFSVETVHTLLSPNRAHKPSSRGVESAASSSKVSSRRPSALRQLSLVPLAKAQTNLSVEDVECSSHGGSVVRAEDVNSVSSSSSSPSVPPGVVAVPSYTEHTHGGSSPLAQRRRSVTVLPPHPPISSSAVTTTAHGAYTIPMAFTAASPLSQRLGSRSSGADPLIRLCNSPLAHISPQLSEDANNPLGGMVGKHRVSLDPSAAAVAATANMWLGTNDPALSCTDSAIILPATGGAPSSNTGSGGNSREGGPRHPTTNFLMVNNPLAIFGAYTAAAAADSATAAAAAAMGYTNTSIPRHRGSALDELHQLLHPSVLVPCSPSPEDASRAIASPLSLGIRSREPAISKWLDNGLRAAFERQALTLPTSYDSVRILVFYFYTSYKLLFKPLTAQERTNLQRRLATAFGVPQQDMVVQLAACCAVRHLQQHPELIHVMWGEAQFTSGDFSPAPV